MFHHHPLAQALPPRLGLVMGAGLLLPSFFGLDTDTPRPLPTDALRAQGTGLTSSLRKKELAPSTFSGGVIVARGLACRATHFHLIQIDRKLTLGKTISVVIGRHLGRQDSFFVRKGSPRRAASVSTIAHRFFYLRLQHSFALLHQLQRFLLIPSIARQYLHPRDQLTLHLHRHRGLVSVEALAGALVSMPHLRIVNTEDPILGGTRLPLAAALRLFFHVLRDQPQQQGGVGGNGFRLRGMLLLDLLRQAQQAPPVLHHLG